MLLGALASVLVADAGASCAEARLRAYEEIPAAFATGDAAEILERVDAWRDVCGSLPEIVRIEVLTLLWADRFDEWVVDTRFVDHLAEIELLDERRATVMADSTLEPFLGAFRFAEFSTALAADVARFRAPGTEEYLIARFYAGDHEALWKRVGAEPYASTLLGQMVAIRRRELGVEFPKFFLGAAVGAWSGTGALGDIGQRLTLGAHGGVRNGPLSLRLNAAAQIGTADSTYGIADQGVVYLSDRFTGYSVAFEPAWRLASRGPVVLEAGIGVGFSGVEALQAETVEVEGEEGFDVVDFPAVWMHSFDRSVGVNLRWQRERRFSEIQIRRRWEDWDTGPGGDELDGGAWELRLVIGLVAKPTRAERWAEVIAAPPAPEPPER